MAVSMMAFIDMDNLLNRRPEFFAGEARRTHARRDVRGVVAAVRYRAKHCIFLGTSGSYITCRVAPPRFAGMSTSASRAFTNQVSALTLD